jgi:hypothetical protein
MQMMHQSWREPYLVAQRRIWSNHTPLDVFANFIARIVECRYHYLLRALQQDSDVSVGVAQ